MATTKSCPCQYFTPNKSTGDNTKPLLFHCSEHILNDFSSPLSLNPHNHIHIFRMKLLANNTSLHNIFDYHRHTQIEFIFS